MAEQAAYDVTYYDLDLQIFPEQQTIAGKVNVVAKIVQPLQTFVLDLDTLLEIEKIEELGGKGKSVDRKFYREGGKVFISLVTTHQPGTTISLIVQYKGKPRVAPMPPWQGGFTWAKTPSGAHWIATTCQGEGADIWWPVKDHVSDEPDSVGIHIRVPDPLVVATNGRFQKQEKHADGTSTYHWRVSTPINAYNIALNIAPYQIIEGELTSVAGDEFPVVFYVLPEDYEKGKKFFPEILDHLRFFEHYLGPYPFRADKYGVAQTPHLGMEHQTIIAYGANFNNGAMTGGQDWGFDALHQHELAHEWWGNLVTNADWKDMWIHEGFGSYMQPLYKEYTDGKEAYHKYMNGMRRFSNRMAVAPRASQSGKEIYRAPIYAKGAWVLHTLRYLVGDEVFFKALRRMAYPDPAMEKITDGRQTRFVATDDFLSICEEESGKELDWFFDCYLHQPKLPILHSRVKDNTLTLRWETPDDMAFPMPVDVQLGDKIQKVIPTKEGITIEFDKGIKPEIDPLSWGMFEVK
ncbi:MAG: aminopeptidase [Saprospiraceae bacterium]|nr:MAG: aminopeptidase [Saprospiraceae bacterium]